MSGMGIMQPSFSSGELAPSLYGRVDLARYQTALRQAENFIVRQYGGITSRPGSLYVATAKYSDKTCRLIPFSFSNQQTYVLEVGELYIRIIQNGAYLTVNGSPLEINTPYGEAVLPELTFGQSADVLTICHPWIQPRQVKRYAATTWALELFTPTGGPFQDLNTDQAKTFFVSGTAGIVLLYTWGWTLAAGDIGSLLRVEQQPNDLVAPWTTTKSYSVGDQVYHGYQYYVAVTAGYPGPYAPSHTEGVVTDGGVRWKWLHDGRGIVQIDWFPEPTTVAIASIAWVSGTAKVTVQTATAHGLVSGQHVVIAGVPVNTIAGDWQAFVVDATHFTIDNHAFTTDPGTITTGTVSTVFGTVAQVSVQGDGELPTKLVGYKSAVAIIGMGFDVNALLVITTATAHGLSTGDPVTIRDLPFFNGNWTVVYTVSAVAIAINMGGANYILYGGGGALFKTTDVLSYKYALSAWGGERGYPTCTCYFQQRQWFAGAPGNPQGVWASTIGGYADFSQQVSIVDSDAIIRTIKTSKVNQILHLVPLNNLIALTTDGPFAIYGDNNGALTPVSVTVRPQGSVAVAPGIMPITLDNFCLYPQAQHNFIRAIGYTWQSDSYQGKDVSKHSNHLFIGHRLTSWAYAEGPFQIIVGTREDGTLLVFTFMPEDEVMGWTRWVTDGAYESVTVVREGQEDSIYLAVRRTIGGATVRYVERLSTRVFGSLAEAYCVDCGVTYVGAPVTSLGGLAHLEGRAVAVVADGVSVGPKTVTGGAITLSTSASRVHVGLAYACTLETLDITTPQGNIRDKQKLINHVSLIVQDSAPFSVGPDSDHLVTYVPPTGVADASGMISGLVDLRTICAWNKAGRVTVRQSNPAPLTVLALIPEVASGGS